MTDSPKRKNSAELARQDNDTKRARSDNDDKDNTQGHDASLTTPPDSYIDHAAAIAYWSKTEPTVNGVLGGYPQVSRIDLQGSSTFFAKLRRQSKHFPPGKKLGRVVDCGAGIGRITDGFLHKIAEVVDIVEPVKQFTAQVKAANVGQIYNVGLEDWEPEPAEIKYDLIWNQWCVGQLTDAQLAAHLKRLPRMLSEGGWIVVKENISNMPNGEDIFDEEDSSVTRTEQKFKKLFDDAALNIVATEQQKGMPQGLYPVRAWALQPQS